MPVIHLLTLPVLGAIAWEDLRERSIHWWWPPLLSIGLAWHQYHANAEAHIASNTLQNLLFLVLQFGGALLLLMLRRRSWTNPLDRFIGSGDLLFCAALTTGFAPLNFILFLLSGLVLCLFWYAGQVVVRPNARRTVPLAGLLAIHLALWIAVDLLSPIHPFTTPLYTYLP